MKRVMITCVSAMAMAFLAPATSAAELPATTEPAPCTGWLRWKNGRLSAEVARERTTAKYKVRDTTEVGATLKTWPTIEFSRPADVVETVHNLGGLVVKFDAKAFGPEATACTHQGEVVVAITAVESRPSGRIQKDGSLALCARNRDVLDAPIWVSSSSGQVVSGGFPVPKDGIKDEKNILAHRGEQVLRAIVSPDENCGVRAGDDDCQNDLWCKADGLKGMELLCVDLFCHGRIVQAPARHVMGPNRGLVVVVRHASQADVSVRWGGNRGLVKADVAGQSPRGSASVDGDASVAKRPDITQLTFPPRLPGQADVEVEVRHGKGAEPTKLKVELEVEPLSWGAVRFGVGSVFGDAAGKTYGTRIQPGSMQREIVVTDESHMSFELVLGFSPYLLDVLCWNGRSHTGGATAHVAPYIGFGLVGENASGLSALKSFHMGLEFEFASNFSLAVTGVARRVSGLSEGFAVGSPVEDNSSFTTEATEWGIAVVLNANPDFLQFRMPVSASAATAGQEENE